jgi:four helix bundle protein
MKFDFERLSVYQKALDFVDWVFKICEKLGVHLQSSLGDQFRRASLSITNNIAEGSGQNSAKMKSKFYGIALNSCRECIPMIELLGRQSLLEDTERDEARSKCYELCKMLRGLIKSTA